VLAEVMKNSNCIQGCNSRPGRLAHSKKPWDRGCSRPIPRWSCL